MTQRVDPTQLADLVDAPPRAALAVATPDGPDCVPVAVRWKGDVLEVGVDPAYLIPAGPPTRATLLVDDGRAWFELRAIVGRGVVVPISDASRDPSPDGTRWFRFVITSSVAWDYGALREVAAP